MTPATLADAVELAPNLREADCREVMRAAGFTPYEALAKSLAATAPRAWAVRFDGELACMAGIGGTDLIGGAGIPWLLTGHAADRHPLAFMRLASGLVDRWADEFPVLVQMVDTEYPGGARFMEALGFTILPPQPHGPGGHPFLPCMRFRNV
jgi:hypothetical protein